MPKGIVIRNTGNRFTVLVDGDNNNPVTCAVKGNLRLKGFRTTNPVAVGDIVELQDEENKNAREKFITHIYPRRNYIIRRASNLSKEAHIIASNVDCAALVATLAFPTTSTTFIDRFLATASAYDIPAILIINKTDLLTSLEDREYLQAFQHLYTHIGYPVFEVSAKDGTGINELNDHLKDKITLLSGNSGVGKSSLINRLIPYLNLKTAAISDAHNTGMHTTTFSEMFPLPQGGWIIDTPGVKGFGTLEMQRDEIDHFFPDIFNISHSCRYNNCSHTTEPGCAVLQALENNTIAQSRYASYLSILDEVSSHSKYRKN